MEEKGRKRNRTREILRGNFENCANILRKSGEKNEFRRNFHEIKFELGIIDFSQLFSLHGGKPEELHKLYPRKSEKDHFESKL